MDKQLFEIRLIPLSDETLNVSLDCFVRLNNLALLDSLESDLAIKAIQEEMIKRGLYLRSDFDQI